MQVLEHTNWRSPASSEKKQALINERWGESVPNYLWYELGSIKELSVEEMHELVRIFFAGTYAGFGSIELHHSTVLSTKTESVTVLRIRGAVAMPMTVTIQGRPCILYMVGHESDERSLNFHTIFGPPQT